MVKQYFLGIDIGTYESKGILVDEKFHIVAEHSEKHTLDNPKPNYFEQDADSIWWGDFCKISRALLKKSDIDAAHISCIGASTLGTDCLPVDDHCRPLRPAILYGIDARAVKEIDFLNSYYGEGLVLELFGHPLCSGDTATKILWIKNNEPEIHQRTHKFLTGSSFITAKLTGKYLIDQFLGKGSFKPIYRDDGSINNEFCPLYCRPDQMPQCANSTDVVGKVTAQAAEETGLKEGTSVITGTGDSTAEGISVGLVEPGTIFFQYGSTMFFYYCVDHFIHAYKSIHGNGSIKSSKFFTVPGTYCIGDGTNAAGTLTRWIRDTLYTGEYLAEKNGGENAYAVMARHAAEIPSGCEGLIMLPYIYGERSPIQDPDVRGLLAGLCGNHDRRHINRAALEAVGYSTLQHMKLFDEMGIRPQRVITAGGGTKNRTWMQIICDMLGTEITVPEDYQCSSYGDAMMAAIGAGYLRDFQSLRQSLPEGTLFKPDPENHTLYEQRYPWFINLYQNNREILHNLAKSGQINLK
jgi:xylulokinase